MEALVTLLGVLGSLCSIIGLGLTLHAHIKAKKKK